MAINATVDGVTYSGIDTINTGGKVIGLTADAQAVNIEDYATRAISGPIDFGSAPFIDSAMFVQFSKITAASGQDVSYIGGNAFELCFALSEVSFPSCEQLYAKAFGNAGLISAYFPALLQINGYGAFINCISLVHFDAPNLLSISGSTFAGCTELKTVNLPALTSIHVQEFAQCSKLEFVNFPNLESVFNSTFFGCTNLSYASLPAVSTINWQGFSRCRNLLSLYLMSSSVVGLSASNAFDSTPIAGYTASTGGVLGSIYVPASLLTAYQSATNWAFFSERFVGV